MKAAAASALPALAQRAERDGGEARAVRVAAALPAEGAAGVLPGDERRHRVGHGLAGRARGRHGDQRLQRERGRVDGGRAVGGAAAWGRVVAAEATARALLGEQEGHGRGGDAVVRAGQRHDRQRLAEAVAEVAPELVVRIDEVREAADVGAARRATARAAPPRGRTHRTPVDPRLGPAPSASPWRWHRRTAHRGTRSRAAVMYEARASSTRPSATVATSSSPRPSAASARMASIVRP